MQVNDHFRCALQVGDERLDIVIGRGFQDAVLTRMNVELLVKRHNAILLLKCGASSVTLVFIGKQARELRALSFLSRVVFIPLRALVELQRTTWNRFCDDPRSRIMPKFIADAGVAIHLSPEVEAVRSGACQGKLPEV
jgi:hypothetical protein